MATLIIAMAPPIPLAVKLVISLFMVALATFLAVSGRKGRWNFVATLTAASFGVTAVIALEFLFPHGSDPGLDGRGILAALIGLVSGGVSAPWLIRKPQ